jgi:hypothetical protein
MLLYYSILIFRAFRSILLFVICPVTVIVLVSVILSFSVIILLQLWFIILYFAHGLWKCISPVSILVHSFGNT